MHSDQIKTKSSLPHSLYPAQQIKDYEGAAAELAGISLYTLMERAGEACYQLLKKRFRDANHLLVLTGKGNNGGDGYVCARLAQQSGLTVQLCQIGNAGDLTGEAAQAQGAWLSAQGVIDGIEQADFERADLIVDALLGSGLLGPVGAEYQRIIHKINQSGKAVLSIDLPAGLNADTGAISSVAVKAQATLCLLALKQGLFTGQALDHCGKVYFSDLGISEKFSTLCPSEATRIIYADLCDFLPSRSRCSHKGLFGKTLIVGGNFGMPGAVRLAAEGALRAGAGLVKVLTRQENQYSVLAGRPELMVDTFDLEKADDSAICDWATNLVIGPGLGKDEWAEMLLAFVLASDLPTVIDADALNLLAGRKVYKDNWILTPHPGEAANLLGCSVSEVEDDRFTAVRNIQRRFGGIVILKGAGTLICDVDQTYIANVGNPGMASGGMGDVLSGIIGGLLAQGLDILQAATLAVTIHGQAADLAAAKGERGLLASDLFPYIRKLVNP